MENESNENLDELSLEGWLHNYRRILATKIAGFLEEEELGIDELNISVDRNRIGIHMIYLFIRELHHLSLVLRVLKIIIIINDNNNYVTSV